MRRRISSPALVGRLHELEVIVDLLAQARESRPSLCIVAGEAGVGKTRMAREFERRAGDTGMRCLRGQCLALAGGEFPFEPFVGIFRQLGSNLREVLLGGPSEAPVSQAHAHASLLDALRDVAAERPTAIVIEDIHWADESTRDFLRYVARSLHDERLAIAATFRSDELPPDDPARVLVAELIRCDAVVCVELDRLTRAQTAEQLAAIAGQTVGGDEVDEIHERAQGNPFIAEELWATRSLAIPPTLGDALLARVRRMPAETQRVLRLLAVFGRPVGIELAGVAADDAEATSAALHRAVDEHILMPTDAGQRLTFRHALVREALYAELLPGERENLHRAVVATLARPGVGSAAERAYHHLAAGQPGAALTASVEAGLVDARRAAYPEALHHFERALNLWLSVEPDGAPPLDRLDVYREASEAARLTGEYERAIEHCRTALQELDVAQDPVRAAGFFERLSRYQSWDVERSLDGLDRALALLGPEPSAERARIMTGQSLQLSLLGRWSEACDRAEQALEVAVASGVAVEECSARTELGLALAFAGDPDAGERSLQRARALAAELAAPEELARVHMYLAELERLRGRTAAALDAMREGQEQATALGAWASWGAFMAVLSADDLLQLGRWDELDALLAAMKDVNAGRPGAVMWPVVAGQLALARGHVDAAVPLLQRARDAALRGVTPELLPHVGAALAELRLWLDDPSAARAHIDETRALTALHDDPLNTPVLYGTGVRVEVRIADAAARDRAQGLIDHLDELLAARPPPIARAWLEQANAELATLDRPAAAVPLWDDVAEAWLALAHPYRAAYARFRHGEALLEAGGQSRRAARTLRLAHEQAATLGAALLRGEIEALARRARLTLTPQAPAPAERGAGHELGLTRREAEVLGLVADGLTNREIGERLFITPKTAGLHVSHILAKLNVDSRVKAAAIAHRADLGR
jgi:DNA-binding CsgD family transcriptional regulator/tetratricopeptide (TPR) repeat protein